VFPGWDPDARRKSGSQKATGKKAGRGSRGLKAEAGEVAYYHDPSTPTTYFKGAALVLSGPATISSRKFNIKYRTGEEEGGHRFEPHVCLKELVGLV
jgi:hypothetical protein